MGARRTVPLTRVSELELPIHEITPTRSPTIVTGVNPKLLEFFDRSELARTASTPRRGLRRHALSIANPWTILIRGKLFIVEPGGYADPDTVIDRSWEISPRVVEFAVRPARPSSATSRSASPPRRSPARSASLRHRARRRPRLPPHAHPQRDPPRFRQDPPRPRPPPRPGIRPRRGLRLCDQHRRRAHVHRARRARLGPRATGNHDQRRRSRRHRRTPASVFESLGPGATVIVSARSDAARIQLNKRLTMPGPPSRP